MPEIDLKQQAIKMGLQIGKNIKVVHTKRAQGSATKIKMILQNGLNTAMFQQ